jgi:hypothetical protein
MTMPNRPFLVAVSLVFALVASDTAIAQSKIAPNTTVKEGGTTEEEPSRAMAARKAPKGGDAGGPRDIFMVTQADSVMTQAEIESKFELARKRTEECTVRDVTVKPIDVNTYLQLKSIILSGDFTVPPPATGATTIEAQPRQEGEWTVNLGSASKYVDAAEVEYKDAGLDAHKITMKAEPKDRTSAGLRYHSPGVYIMRLPLNRIPKSVALTIRNEGDDPQQQPKVETVVWPDAGRCYLVTLSGVEGDEQELFKTLQDKTKTANPLKGLKDASKAALMVASFKEELAEEMRFTENGIILTFPKPNNVDPKRIWMRFPLNTQELEGIRKELDEKFATSDGFRTVPGWIRSNLLGDRLTPEGSSGWFEIPWVEDRQMFERTLAIDTKAWQERLINNRDYMGDNAVLMYEFESEDGNREIIKVEGYQRYRPKKIAEWLAGLPNAPSPESKDGQ